MKTRRSSRRPDRPRGPFAAPILTTERLLARVARLRRGRPRRRVILANGLFDLLHVGHVRYLRAARRAGDLLVVALNADGSARRLKGPGRPIAPARDRARLVAAIEGVDAVVLFRGSTVGPLLRRLRPDVHCKGTDYTKESVPEREVVRGYGGTVRIAGDRKRHATSDLIGLIAARSGRSGGGGLRRRG
jgi:rfaE bifunctional protein nucleotidyltransferase chain/domain